jgi:hypothetical protein
MFSTTTVFADTTTTKKDRCIAWVNSNKANLAKNYLAYRTSPGTMGQLILGQHIVQIAQTNCKISGEFNRPTIVEMNSTIHADPINVGKPVHGLPSTM